MASHYRKIIANILQEFDSYRLNYSIYESIAWMGLRNIENNESTKAWNDLSPSEKQNVLNQINEHIFNGPSICN